MGQDLRNSLDAFLDAPIASTMKRLRLPVPTDLSGATTLRATLTQPRPPVALVKQLIGATEIEQAARVGLPEPVMQVIHLAAIATAIVHRQIKVLDDGPVREALKMSLRREWVSPDLVQLFNATLSALDESASAPVASLTDTLSEIHSATKPAEAMATNGPARESSMPGFLKSEKVRRAIAIAILVCGCIPLAYNLTAAQQSEPEYEGFHDPPTGAMITGWVWDRSAPNQPLEVTIDDGKNPTVKVLADVDRPDIFGKGNGRHGFIYTVPAAQRDGRTYNVWVRIAGTRRILDETPRTYVYR